MSLYEEVNIQVPNTAAGTASRGQWYNTTPHAYRVDLTSLKIIPDTSVTTDGTNYTTYTLSRNRSATLVTLATFTTNSSGGAALTQWTAAAMTAAAVSGTSLEIIQGDGLVVTKAESGSGKNGGALVSLHLLADRVGGGA